VKIGDFPDVRDAAILAGIGPGFATLFPDSAPIVVLGTESRGSLLGTLVARHLPSSRSLSKAGCCVESTSKQQCQML
jgi:adenine/guanine phosphoribosyltransferase-like PRPP-binding protein